MEEKLEKIIELNEKTVAHLEKRESALSKALHLFEKLIVPMMLAILAYVANESSNRIAGSQLGLQKSQLELAQNEALRGDNNHREATRSKYIEVFIKEISSDDPLRQKNALSILKILDNELATQISGIIDIKDLKPDQVPAEPKIVRNVASATTIARATGRSGNWIRYTACVSIPEGAEIDKETAKSRVVAGVGAGPWGNWEGNFTYPNPNKVCRVFAHQIHDQDRILEMSVEYTIKEKS